MNTIDFINNPYVWIAFIIILFLVIYTVNIKRKEGYGLSTITQITARGPQDTYLTNDAHKYLPKHYYPGSKFPAPCPALSFNGNWPKYVAGKDGVNAYNPRHNWYHPYYQG